MAQTQNWKHKYEELVKLINKIYEMQGPVLQLTDKQTTQGTEEPLNRLQQLESLLSGLAKRNSIASSDLMEELNNVKETLKREMTISKGLRRTIENLQEENKRLSKTAGHEKNDGIEIRKDNNLEFKDQSKTKVEESKVIKSEIMELREKVHELEKENKSLQQKLAKKEKELEETGKVFEF